MDPSISPPDIESALLRIRQYAREHDLTPDEVCDYFSTELSPLECCVLQRI